MNKQVEIPDHIKYLISGYLSDTIEPDELTILRAWLEESSVNKKHFNSMRYAWMSSGDDAGRYVSEKGLTELMNSISLPGANSKQSRPFWTWQKIAASWTIFIILSGVSGWFMRGEKGRPESERSPEAKEVTVHTKLGSQSTVSLPDGSTVWINAGSKISYNDSYNEQEREISLTGEACFDVKTDPEKPFIVKVGNLSVKALGTTFNIKAYPEDEAITTTLVEGKVIIEGTDENDEKFSITMKPNENITYLTNHKSIKEHQPVKVKPGKVAPVKIPESVIVKDNVKPELYTSWKDEYWIIEKQVLGDLARDFERRYDVVVRFDSESVAAYHFSGTIQRETIEQVMLILQRTIPLKYVFNKNEITIREDKKLAEEFDFKNR
jgi:ferric-dicitrate binding protein FerR (iron transport regulator)